MKLPVYPIGSFYFIRGKLSSIRSGTTPTIRTIFQRAAIRKPAPSECPPETRSRHGKTSKRPVDTILYKIYIAKIL